MPGWCEYKFAPDLGAGIQTGSAWTILLALKLKNESMHLSYENPSWLFKNDMWTCPLRSRGLISPINPCSTLLASLSMLSLLGHGVPVNKESPITSRDWDHDRTVDEAGENSDLRGNLDWKLLVKQSPLSSHRERNQHSIVPSNKPQFVATGKKFGPCITKKYKTRTIKVPEASTEVRKA